MVSMKVILWCAVDMESVLDLTNVTVMPMSGLEQTARNQCASVWHQPINQFAQSVVYTQTRMCECQPGRTGANCESNICFGINEIDTSVCSGHDICYSVDKCNCSYGWTGKDCSNPVCFGIPFDHRDTCSEVGTCVHADTCNCS